MIVGHGDDLYRYPEIKANFSSNVYAETDNTALIQHLKNIIADRIGSYPDPEPYTLQKLLAEYHKVTPEHILVTNGATEAIYLIAHTFAGQPVSIDAPTFSEYRSATTLFASPIEDGASIRWICNPNNPTGRVQDEVCTDDQLLIIDRSYEYFSRRSLPPLSLDDRHIYIYSLTKRYRIPGLRLGYLIADPRLVEQIATKRQPWSVNALAIEAGLWIARHNFPDSIDRVDLFAKTDILKERLQQIDGVEVEDTDTHFMLLKTPLLAKTLKDRLAYEYKILVRDASNFDGLSPYHIRIATQGAEDNEKLLTALNNIMS